MSDYVSTDEGLEWSADLSRPARLEDFNGQTAAKGNIEAFVSAARKMNKAMDHVLFYGPPGVGKTTLAQIVANELGASFKTMAAPSIEKPSDILSALASMEDKEVLFIDEIHRLPAKVEEMLYTAMEDFKVDVIIGDGSSAQAVSVPLAKFTLIGATTRPGMLSAPLRDRFGIPVRLELYTDEEMQLVVRRACVALGLAMSDDAVSVLSQRSRGTPRVALRLLRRIQDFAVNDEATNVPREIAEDYLHRLGIDEAGFDETDRRYISTLRERFKGGPVGITTLASALNESVDTIESSVEPYLIRKGVIDKTPRGRKLNTSCTPPKDQLSFPYCN